MTHHHHHQQHEDDDDDDEEERAKNEIKSSEKWKLELALDGYVNTFWYIPIRYDALATISYFFFTSFLCRKAFVERINDALKDAQQLPRKQVSRRTSDRNTRRENGRKESIEYVYTVYYVYSSIESSSKTLQKMNRK